MHHALDQAIGTTPVSTVDVDDVVATARRRSLRRRCAIAAGGTAFAVVTAVAALALTAVGPPPNLPPPQVRPAAHSGTAPVRGSETQEQIRQRLAAALTRGLTAALPGVHLADGPTGRPGVVVSFEKYPGTDLARYSADTVLTTATGQSELFLESWSGGRVPVPTAPATWPSNQPAPPVAVIWIGSCADLRTTDAVTPDGHRIVNECDESSGPDGQTIVDVSERCVECPDQPTFRHDVYVTWNNARVALSITRDLKRGDSVGSPTAPLLSREQVVAIAIDPELTVTS